MTGQGVFHLGWYTELKWLLSPGLVVNLDLDMPKLAFGWHISLRPTCVLLHVNKENSQDGTLQNHTPCSLRQSILNLLPLLWIFDAIPTVAAALSLHSVRTTRHNSCDTEDR